MKLASLCASCLVLPVVIAVVDRTCAAPSHEELAGAAQVETSGANNYRGGLINPPIAKPQFTLTDTSGAGFDFHAETEGYVTLLFFGYTYCASECPLQMAILAMALQQMPEEVRRQIKVVFVTADPSRDNPVALRAWLDNFDRRFIGLVGNTSAIESAQRAALIPAATKNALGRETYEVAHASFVLAYTKDNLARLIYPGGVTASDWGHDLPRLVKEWGEKKRPVGHRE